MRKSGKWWIINNKLRIRNYELNYELGITNYELNYELGITNYELNYELRITNYELRVKLQIRNYELRIANMKKDNVVRDKSFAFAVKVINVYKYLQQQKKEYVLSKQLLRSGTSIGANIEESMEKLQVKFKRQYNNTETQRMSEIRDLPPVR